MHWNRSRKREGTGRSQDHLSWKNLNYLGVNETCYNSDVIVGEEERLKDEDRNNRLDVPSSQSCFKKYSADACLCVFRSIPQGHHACPHLWPCQLWLHQRGRGLLVRKLQHLHLHVQTAHPQQQHQQHENAGLGGHHSQAEQVQRPALAFKEQTLEQEDFGHYVIASSRPAKRRPAKRRPMERRSLVPKQFLSLGYSPSFVHSLSARWVTFPMTSIVV